MNYSLVCPICKHHLQQSSENYICPKCNISYASVDRIPVLLPLNQTDFKQMEYQYWNQRFKQESNITQLKTMYAQTPLGKPGLYGSDSYNPQFAGIPSHSYFHSSVETAHYRNQPLAL